MRRDRGLANATVEDEYSTKPAARSSRDGTSVPAGGSDGSTPIRTHGPEVPADGSPPHVNWDGKRWPAARVAKHFTNSPRHSEASQKHFTSVARTRGPSPFRHELPVLANFVVGLDASAFATATITNLVRQDPVTSSGTEVARHIAAGAGAGTWLAPKQKVSESPRGRRVGHYPGRDDPAGLPGRVGLTPGGSGMGPPPPHGKQEDHEAGDAPAGSVEGEEEELDAPGAANDAEVHDGASGATTERDHSVDFGGPRPAPPAESPSEHAVADEGPQQPGSSPAPSLEHSREDKSQPPADKIACLQKLLGVTFNGIWYGYTQKYPNRAKGASKSNPFLHDEATCKGFLDAWRRCGFDADEMERQLQLKVPGCQARLRRHSPMVPAFLGAFLGAQVRDARVSRRLSAQSPACLSARCPLHKESGAGAYDTAAGLDGEGRRSWRRPQAQGGERDGARRELDEARQTMDEQRLREAIAQAEQMGLEGSEEVLAARRAYSEALRRDLHQQPQEMLQFAVDHNEEQMIADVFQEMKDRGAPAAEDIAAARAAVEAVEALRSPVPGRRRRS
ncbi:unnamed protein product [Prorocentrum cordatum]|uniref:Uncharacterized protein n=1 Tax=Prorocentrum cordatum TaxID=2364126 RepID=A0ABN9STA4_9DINO|nr:unnamed protein product [Polarella glacialis]